MPVQTAHSTLRRPLVVQGGTPALDVSLKRFKPVPEEGIEAAVELMRRGDTFRYGAASPDASQVSRLEREFSAQLGVRHTVAVNSCGSALFLALKAAGVQPGDPVLLNAFTFTAVPSAVVHAGGRPVYVECDRGWRLDPDDLDAAAEASGAKVLVLSYMRGHIPNLDRVVEICERHDLFLIEDCAHALCSRWRGRPLGTFGDMATFSAQSSKALAAGEGGFLCTDDDDFAARGLLMSGSYERQWRNHLGVPELVRELEQELPSFSLRMSEIAGAVLRPQLSRLHELDLVHRRKHHLLASLLQHHPHLEIPPPLEHADQLGDTLQFHLVGLQPAQADRVVELAALEGVPLQIFGRGANARDYRNWRYAPADRDLPRTRDAIAFACDLPLGAHLEDDHLYAIADALDRVIDYVLTVG